MKIGHGAWGIGHWALGVGQLTIQNSNILDNFRRSRSVSQRRGVRSWGFPKRSNSGGFKR
ncbi:MAG: hypothetical protein V7K24_05865 [Nostoc sp.]